MYAWKITVKNSSTVPSAFDVEIKWVDGDGFVVETSNQQDLNVSGGLERTFTGVKQIGMPGAAKVDDIKVTISR